MNDYVTAQHRSVPPNTGEIEYKRNPVSEIHQRVVGSATYTCSRLSTLQVPAVSMHQGVPYNSLLWCNRLQHRYHLREASLDPSPLVQDRELAPWDLVPSLASLVILRSHLLTILAPSRSLITGASVRETCRYNKVAQDPDNSFPPVAPTSKHPARDMATAALSAQLVHHSWVPYPSSRAVLLHSRQALTSLLMNAQVAARTLVKGLRALDGHHLLMGRPVIPRLLPGPQDPQSQFLAFHSAVCTSATV